MFLGYKCITIFHTNPNLLLTVYTRSELKMPFGKQEGKTLYMLNGAIFNFRYTNNANSFTL